MPFCWDLLVVIGIAFAGVCWGMKVAMRMVQFERSFFLFG